MAKNIFNLQLEAVEVAYQQYDFILIHRTIHLVSGRDIYKLTITFLYSHVEIMHISY